MSGFLVNETTSSLAVAIETLTFLSLILADIYDVINNKVPKANNSGNYSLDATKAAFHFLVLPWVDSIGSLLSFVIPVVVGRSFLEGKMPGDDEVYQLMMEGYKFSEEEFRLLGVYDRMLVDIMEEDGSGGTKIPLNISLFEIPAIMQKKFVGMHFASFLVGTTKKQMIFSQHFLTTVSQPSQQTFEYSDSKAPLSWSDVQDGNYFGKILSLERNLTLKVLVASVLGGEMLKEWTFPGLFDKPG